MTEPPDSPASKYVRWLIYAFAVYLLPAFVIIADEEYFHWISGQITPEFGAVFCKFYPWVCVMYGG